MRYLIFSIFFISITLFVIADEKIKDKEVKVADKKAKPVEKYFPSDDTENSKKVLPKLDKQISKTWKESSLKEVFKDLSSLLDIKFDIDKSIKLEDEEETTDFEIKEMKGVDVIRSILKNNKLKCTITDGVLVITP
jgi:hypothetical protein